MFGGFYNVAAGVNDFGFVDWVIVRVRDASMQRHASETTPIELDDPEMIRAGAREFAQYGCVNCHGGPGIDWAKFAEGLNFSPPDLKEEANSEPA
ncbi:MAG: hypothetical protein ACXWKC_12795 [Xanthobacteraceae bacterium]